MALLTTAKITTARIGRKLEFGEPLWRLVHQSIIRDYLPFWRSRQSAPATLRCPPPDGYIHPQLIKLSYSFIFLQFRARESKLQTDRLRRRNFITLLGGALGWSLGARAQEPAVPVIGFLSSGSLTSFQRHLDAFREGLSERGYVEGRNVAIDYRWADGQLTRLPELAADLVRRRVSLIAATGGSVSAIAAKNATAAI